MRIYASHMTVPLP